MLAFAVSWVVGLSLSAPPPPPPDFGPLYALFQQLEDDYVEAREIGEDELLEAQVEVGQHALAVATALGNRPLTTDFQKLLDGMTAHVASADLFSLFRSIEKKLDAAGRFPRWPSRPPEIHRAEGLYAQLCATCHGPKGAGDGPSAPALRPPPENLLTGDVINHMSPWRAYVSITYGVHGTAMPAFETLTEDDRWALAFLMPALRQPECSGKGPKVALKDLAIQPDMALYARYTEAALPCLRRGLPR